MKKNEVQMWMEYALQDMKLAEISYRQTKFFPYVIFHCHEAVEKYLKGLIRMQGNDFPYVHLLDLLSDAVQVSPDDQLSLSNIGIALDELFRYSRYPGNDEFTEDQAIEVLKKAKEAEKIILKYME